MRDLISRKDAIALVDRPVVPTGDADYDNARECERESIKDDLLSLPSAEQKTGEWIKAKGMMPPEFHGHHCCSECGAFANMDAPHGNREDLSKFCPSCGSRMLGEDGEKCTNITK